MSENSQPETLKLTPATPVHLPVGTVSPEGLLDAFWEYERALMTNDLPALDALRGQGDGAG